METKKISFGFMKTKKADKPVVEEKKDFIDCLEEKSIKIVGSDEVKEEKPLIIAMKPNTMITAERLKQIADEVETAVENFESKENSANTNTIEVQKTAENESLDQMAVRELIEDAKKERKLDASVLTLSLPQMGQSLMAGGKESTLDDYESIPVKEFGMAMLRGMGWSPGKESKYKQPVLRPKGLGLGADKVIKPTQKTSKGDEKELTIVKGGHVKITAGKYSGYYGKVVSLDEDNGRVLVDIVIKKETVSINEYIIQPVTKADFELHSRVLNANKYEEYKKNEKANQSKNIARYQSKLKLAINENKDRRTNEYIDSSSNRKDNGERRERSSSSDERTRRKHRESKNKYNSTDSLDSSPETEKKYHRDRKTRDSSSSSSDTKKKHKKDKKNRSESRDIDKKRKGKKKKRDRDRSPNYRKYKK